jgi:hypothetical protein
MQPIRHFVAADWSEYTVPILGVSEVTLMIRIHRLIYRPTDRADAAILSSLSGKVNARPFLDCDVEHLLCVNSDWLVGTQFVRPEYDPPDRSGEPPEFDPTPAEWSVVIYERAQLGWNERYEPAVGGRVRKVRRESYASADFVALLGDPSTVN